MSILPSWIRSKSILHYSRTQEPETYGTSLFGNWRMKSTSHLSLPFSNRLIYHPPLVFRLHPFSDVPPARL